MRGHQLIAQIAFDNLSPQALQLFGPYYSSHGKYYSSEGLIDASTWLDRIRREKNHRFDVLHYIDIPFSKDKTCLPPVPERNALWGINQSIQVLLSSQSSVKDKRLSIRILVHLVGDIHQPLHTVTKISRRLPKGDAGGNLFYLGKNSIGKNLHQYWDNGGGVLIGKNKKIPLKIKAKQLEKKWPCEVTDKLKSPQEWIEASHRLAINQAYRIRPHQKPNKIYRFNAQLLTERQIAYAGCRLATLLNEMAISKKHPE